MTKSAFACLLGVHRSCLTRYESEELGAPPKVINDCLRAIAAHLNPISSARPPLAQALHHARQGVELLERATPS